MLARKMLKYQVTDEIKIQKIISFLCSESGSHDYTINRREAKNELGLVIEEPNEDLYKLINCIYTSIKDELELLQSLDPYSYMGMEREKEYSIKRTLIESVNGGSDYFISEGRFVKHIISLNPTIQGATPIKQEGIADSRIFEGWKHYD